ncbi:DUF2752 domain-containing protein [Porphyromonas catoniae]|uniref:DUF2752 domain-containing protein n=1 Tax=Porphyromonas catoniae TaxID=41976 RepID=UPI003C6DDC2C
MCDAHKSRCTPLYRRGRWLLVLVLGLVLVILYYALEPSSGSLPSCLLLRLTGFRCPGCGTQRAVHALLHGDFAQGIAYNYSLLFTVPILALYISDALWGEKTPRLRGFLHHPIVILLLVSILLAWWILRNCWGY